MQTQNHSVPNVDAVLFVMAEPVAVKLRVPAERAVAAPLCEIVKC